MLERCIVTSQQTIFVVLQERILIFFAKYKRDVH